MMEIIDYIEKISDGLILSEDESYHAFSIIMSGECTESQISGFLLSLKTRGEAITEIIGAVRAIREKMVTIDTPEGTIDIVGTGGDGMKTLNISTAASIVVAGQNVKVAKHGNRSVSSLSGSSDILNELNININLSPESSLKCLNETNICFLFAPLYHNSFKYVAKTRSEIKIRTIFNILGPLCNPGNVKMHLLGSYNKKWLTPMIKTLQKLGSQSAWAVHSMDGLDEISISDKTYITKLSNNEINESIFDCSQYKTKGSPISRIIGNDSKYNAKELLKILNGEKNAYREVVVLNSAAAFVVAQSCKTINEGIDMAEESIDKGNAIKVLNKLETISNKLK
ncbi:MAG: anthranilate phosphoribosyltransferase [Hyphomicrobiales bacterium]|nr:anthranilate phosphoribosyltransferase [Hyphomicrobiales bacterium]